MRVGNKNITARKAAQLQMPWGTAVNRLRKRIIFMLIREAGFDTCIRCETRIESMDDMSIEHIQPWLDVDPELFWDVDNVAFAHTRCNRPNRPDWQTGLEAARQARLEAGRKARWELGL